MSDPTIPAPATTDPAPTPVTPPSAPAESAPTLNAAPDATALLDARTVFAAAAEPVRFGMLTAMARRGPLSVNELAAEAGRAPDVITKHLRVLRDARVIVQVTRAGEDGRKVFHDIPAPFRKKDTAGRTVLDFGAAALRV